MQRQAAATTAMGVDKRRDLASEPGLRQRLDHDVALPGTIGFRLPMLDGAAAADAEMRAERGEPRSHRSPHCEQPPAVGMMAGYRPDLNFLAGKGVGHVDGFTARQSRAI